jgi:uroporphyrinogen decarboxylase
MHSPAGIEVSARELADRELAFQEKFDWDMARVAPAAAIFTVDWGCRYTGANHLGVPTVLKKAVESISDWKKIRVLDPESGKYGLVAEAVGMLSREVRGQKPNLITAFSPLTMAQKLAAEGVLEETMQREPALLEDVLERIARTTIGFIRLCAARGGDALYFATQTANTSFVNDDQFARWELAYDNLILNETIKDSAASGGVSGQWQVSAPRGAELYPARLNGLEFRILHLHGDYIRIRDADRFHVEVLNWADRRAIPVTPLSEGVGCFQGTIMGGINGRSTLTSNEPRLIEAELEDALAQMDGKPFILSPCCVIPLNGIDDGSLSFIREFARKEG